MLFNIPVVDSGTTLCVFAVKSMLFSVVSYLLAKAPKLAVPLSPLGILKLMV